MGKITIKLPASGPLRRRAIELFHADSPFRGRREENRRAYKRRAKNQKEVDKDQGL